MSTPVNEAQLRLMSRDELLAFALKSLSKPASDLPPVTIAPSVSAKRLSDDALRDDKPAKKRRKDRPFDMSRYGQRMIALKFSYLGWHFHGLASQPNSNQSVEDHLFFALLRTKLVESREDCDFSRAGRTDVGVSALGQVAGVRVRSNVVSPSTGKVELDYAKMLNSMLPAQIRVLCWAPAPEGNGAPVADVGGDDAVMQRDAAICDAASSEKQEMLVRRPGERFDARFDAVYRSYKYFFTKGSLDIGAMREAAKFYVGRHDFRNFCKMDVEKTTNFERTMFEVEVRRLHDDDPVCDPASDAEVDFTKYYFFVRGQAFLWHQIRCMVAVLFQVGLGLEKPEIVRRMLDDATTGTGHFSKGKPSYQMAPPIPLLLYECAYPPSVVSFGVDVPPGRKATETSFAFADRELACLYAEAAAQTSIAHTMLAWNDSVPMRMNAGLGGDIEKDTGTGSRAGSSFSFKAVRGKRLLLPAADSGKLSVKCSHVPFDRRKQEPTMEMRMHSLVQRRAGQNVLIGAGSDCKVAAGST